MTMSATACSICGCIPSRTTRFRGEAIGTNTRRRTCSNGYGASTGVKFEFTGFEFLQITLVLEEDYLAISLAAELQSHAQLRHRRVTDESVYGHKHNPYLAHHQR